MIAILKYGVGNLFSVQNMLKKAGVSSIITDDPAVIRNADKIILPGVGHFKHCMDRFDGSGLRSVVEECSLHHTKPLLGICVGHQMLFGHSEEGDCQGLAWLPGEVVRFDKAKMSKEYKIPHMGWTDIKDSGVSTLYSGLDQPRYYFVHSYHVVCDRAYVGATADYGYEFVASVSMNNIHGVQFHPEKSHRFGLQLLRNFADL